MREKKSQTAVLITGVVLTVLAVIGLIIGFIQKGDALLSSDNKLIIYSFILAIAGIVILVTGLLKAIHKGFNYQVVSKKSSTSNVIILAQAGLFAALAYIGFTFFRIDIPVGPGSTAFHFGNTFVVLAALLIGGPWGGLSGAVGLSLADLTSGKYFTTAPQTFFLKLFIGLISGFVAHKVLKLSVHKEKSQVLWRSIVASTCGMAFNVVADPVVGYFYKKYILGLGSEVAFNWAKLTALTTFVNAITSVIFAVILYNLLRPALVAAGLFVSVDKNTH